MQQQLLQDPIYCWKKLKKSKKSKKSFKKNPKIKIGQFSISAWLEARFPSYSQKLQTWEGRYMLTTEGFSTCLLTVSVTHRWSHMMLLSAFSLFLSFICDVISMAVREQLRRCELVVGYLYSFSGFAPDPTENVGIFPTIVGPLLWTHNGEKNSHILCWIWGQIQNLL